MARWLCWCGLEFYLLLFLSDPTAVKAAGQLSPNTSKGWHDGVGEIVSDIGDRYDYDAFGNLINQSGTTANNSLFAGEQFDPALGIYYNRARYYDERSGRFWSMDTEEGEPQSPGSLHKYLYTGANPIDRIDPAGHDFNLASQVAVAATITILSNLAITALAITAPNGKHGGTGIPSGLLFSARLGAAYKGIYGGGVDFYFEFSSRTLFYSPVAEIGISPITLFKNYNGLQYGFTGGFVFADSIFDLEGLSFAAVYPVRFFRAVAGLLPGTSEAFGTLTAIARSTKNISFSNWAAIVGYSPSGASYFEVGPKSNAFSTVAGYNRPFRPLLPDIGGTVGRLADKVRDAISNYFGSQINPDYLPDIIQSLNGE